MQRRGVCGGTAIVSPYLGTQTNAATTFGLYLSGSVLACVYADVQGCIGVAGAANFHGNAIAAQLIIVKGML